MRFMVACAVLVSLLGASARADCTGFATTPLASFKEIDGRRGAFVMALGAFSDGRLLDEVFALTLDGSETTTRLIDGWFEGMMAGPDGFSITMSVGLEIAQNCDVNGCHPRLDGTTYLVFLERVRGRYEFAEDGCGYRAYQDPTPETLARLVSCLNGTCE